MKHTIQQIAAAFVAVIALAGCTQIEIAEETIPVALSYSTVQLVETKAAQDLNKGTFASGETIKVEISNTGAGVWTGYDFTTGNAGAMTPPNPGPHYPAGSTTIDIVAYYPATAGSTFSVATDQTADASYKASDLMYASVTNQAKQTAPVNLSFSHKMAKLNVNITAGDGVGSITSVSLLNVKPTVAFTHSTGAVGEASGDPISIQMSNNGAAVIPAQTISGGLLSIVTDVGTATYSVTSKEFEAGREYTINLAVKLTDVGATSAITDWTTTVLIATADHKGWIITADGSIYPNKAAVEAVGKTGVAMIFFVGDKGRAEHNYRGLAISLVKSTTKFSWGYHWDHTDEKCIRSWYSDFAHAVTDLYGLENTLALRSHECHPAAVEVMDHPEHYGVIPAGTVGWFLGAVEQWKLFFDYCGVTWEQKEGNNFGTPTGDVNVSEKVAAAFAASGYEISNIGRYWSSTQGTYASGGPRAWRINISDNKIDVRDAAYELKNETVWPFLTF